MKSINESVGDGALDLIFSVDRGVQFRIRGVTGVTRRGGSEQELSASFVELGTVSVLSVACSASISRVSKTSQGYARLPENSMHIDDFSPVCIARTWFPNMYFLE